MSRKKWLVSGGNKDAAALVAEECGVDPFAAFLLSARGMEEPFEVDTFLYDCELSDPFELPDMPAAVEAVNSAIEAGKRITVFGDYDTDGVTATALLYSYLQSRGADVDYYIPDREAEGYGLGADAVYTLKEHGTQMIITVDNGINANEEARLIKELGMELVVTDHHRCFGELPEALAVVDPHRDDYTGEFTDWAGVGVAFKLVCALNDGEIADILSEYADLVAVGTIADVVPLIGENRILVKEGLILLNRGSRIGFSVLRASAGDKIKEITSVATAFTIAPRLNAAGRMGSAERALKLLLTQSEDEAATLCEEINSANNDRRSAEAEIEKEAEKLFANNPALIHDRVIVIDGEGWCGGVLGIVAAHICEKTGKPTVVISRDGETAKGSGRSVEGFSLFDALSAVSDILLQFGGHTLAAGLSLNSSDIPDFRQKINKYASEREMPYPVLKLDCKLNPNSVNTELIDGLEVLEPFGSGNPQPLFGIFNLTITSIQPVGNGKHLRISFKRADSNITAMYFGMTAERFPFVLGDGADIAVRLEKNEYMGEMRVSLQIKDIRPASAEDDTVLAAQRLYEHYMSGGELSSAQAGELYPDRELITSVYLYLKRNVGISANAELICRRLSLESSKMAAVSVALDVLLQLKLIDIDVDNRVILLEVTEKRDLESSAILISLNALCNGRRGD